MIIDHIAHAAALAAGGTGKGPLGAAAGRGLPTASSIATPYNAPVAQLDRVSASEAEGRGFESRRAHSIH
jgi:hypothetical protein